MKKFLGHNFMLKTETARRLYFGTVEGLPIIDYHCHLPPSEILQNRRFKNITEAWLGGDHYKWRLMRVNGVNERLITGDGDDKEKFAAWAGTLEKLIGNPVYHWTQLELLRYFGIDEPLTHKNCSDIYTRCNKMLMNEDMSARGLIARSGVEALCTTDDPADSLDCHLALLKSPISARVRPAFRPDRAIDITRDDFCEYVAKLEDISNAKIADIDALVGVLCERMDFFAKAGCKLSDMGFEYLPFIPTSRDAAAAIFKAKLAGETISTTEADMFRTYMTIKMMEGFSERGWATQLHVGALRNVNPGLFASLGRDVGCDVIADPPLAAPLAALLGELDGNKKLPKTVLYSLNSKDYNVIAALTGAFAESGVMGKIQFGSAWWFADNRDGMVKQLRELANAGMLAHFVGMLTDSRSFLSYPRHEYFRRIFVNLVGEWVEDGEFPCDWGILESIVRGVCHDNAAAYFAL